MLLSQSLYSLPPLSQLQLDYVGYAIVNNIYHATISHNPASSEVVHVHHRGNETTIETHTKSGFRAQGHYDFATVRSYPLRR